VAHGALTVPPDLLVAVPRGWFHDSTVAVLGRGSADWGAAREAVDGWRFYPTGWIHLHRPPRIEVGAVAALVMPFGPVWFTNWCRIVEVIDEADRFGFVYATLEDHAETGAERFLVTRSADDVVRWELTAVSRPGAWYSWIGQPIVRLLQARFRRDAATAMRAAIDRNATHVVR
jgi:uncharacterized protein (UPF0548 family)